MSLFTLPNNNATLAWRIIEQDDCIADTNPDLIGDIFISGFDNHVNPGNCHGTRLIAEFLKAARFGRIKDQPITKVTRILVIPWCGFGDQQRLRAFYKSLGFFNAGDYWEYQLPLPRGML